MSLLISLGDFFFFPFAVLSSPAGFLGNWKEKESPASLTSSLKETPSPWLERCLDNPRHSLNRTWVGGLADMMNGEGWVERELRRAELGLITVRFLHGAEMSGHTRGVVSTRSDGLPGEYIVYLGSIHSLLNKI